MKKSNQKKWTIKRLKKTNNYDAWDQKQLRELLHNDCGRAFSSYLKGSMYSKDKKDFLFRWIRPDNTDMIIECGSSSGRTSIDLARRGGCMITGIDFDPEAVIFAINARDRYFPEIAEICRFKKDDLATMVFDNNVTKIIMPDFTEHIPDKVFSLILKNIKKQLPEVSLYIYTPIRTHYLEILKSNNLILKNPEGHINVKSEKELVGFLSSHGWEIIDIKKRPSFIPILRYIEMLLGKVPYFGRFFHRKIAIIARPNKF